jgi:hypothetical protein
MTVTFVGVFGTTEVVNFQNMRLEMPVTADDGATGPNSGTEQKSNRRCFAQAQHDNAHYGNADFVWTPVLPPD